MHHACPCGKRGYTSPRAARSANLAIGARLRIYACDQSHWYHVANADKSPRLAREIDIPPSPVDRRRRRRRP